MKLAIKLMIVIMWLVVVVSSSNTKPKHDRPVSRIPSLMNNQNKSSLKLKIIKFESKAADMGLTREIAAQFLSSHGYLLYELRELQNNYEDIKVSYQLTSASPMRSLVNNKFHEVSSKGHRKLLPRRSTHIKPTHNTLTHNKSTKQQHKRPKSVWEFMGLRG